MPSRSANQESSDDEAPETFSFGSSKKAAKAAQNELLQFEAAEKLKRKEKNRQIDRLKKERAAQTKSRGKGKEVERPNETRLQASDDEEAGSIGERDDLEARMERAMKDAENESDEEDEEMASFGEVGEAGEGGSGSWQGHSDKDGETDEQDADDDEDEDADQFEDEEMGDAAEEDEDMLEEGEDEDATDDKPNSRYLSDSLFESAFAQVNAAKPSKSTTKSQKKNANPPPKKRKRAIRKNKDVVIGSRIIRTLEPTTGNHAVASRTAVAPLRINKFINRSLKLKAKTSAKKTNGWERKPANVGVMKRNGPAANFARNG